jgi:hypothetical protein
MDAPISLDEARASRNHSGEMVNLNGDPAPVSVEEPTLSPTPTEGKILAEQLVMFVSVDGLRRIQVVHEPWLQPPLTIELECGGRQMVIAVPNAKPETRAYRYQTTILVRDVGIMIHVYQEQ